MHMQSFGTISLLPSWHCWFASSVCSNELDSSFKISVMKLARTVNSFAQTTFLFREELGLSRVPAYSRSSRAFCRVHFMMKSSRKAYLRTAHIVVPCSVFMPLMNLGVSCRYV